MLCAEIERHGGDAIAFPAVEIEPVAVQATVASVDYDLVVFVSVNAVEHGVRLDRQGVARTRIAAIGRATAAALAAADWRQISSRKQVSTAKLCSRIRSLQLTSGARVLIVRGEGGRELLQETFVAHGMAVETREVYRRVRPIVDAGRVAEVEARWADEGIDVVTATSIETLQNLQALLTERGRTTVK